MARKRMLSPEMFTSPTVSRLPVTARWTWAGLLCYLDDYGYGEDSAALIKAAVWPRDHLHNIKRVAADLDKITEEGSACRFTCCHLAQLHVPKWDSWQKVAHPGKFRFCPCPTHGGEDRELHTDLSRDPHEDLTNVSSLIEVSLNESSSKGADKARRALREATGNAP
jgi:hypothetical protein